MPSESGNLPEQEISIKARAHELFVGSEPAGVAPPVKPFPVYLRETPAVPISGTIKAVLWMVGIIVALLFIAAVWRLMVRQGGRQRPPAAARSAARTEAFLPLFNRWAWEPTGAAGLARNRRTAGSDPIDMHPIG
jgi:hypothetical protein